MDFLIIRKYARFKRRFSLMRILGASFAMRVVLGQSMDRQLYLFRRQTGSTATRDLQLTLGLQHKFGALAVDGGRLDPSDFGKHHRDDLMIRTGQK